jgi:hypothetical protein
MVQLHSGRTIGRWVGCGCLSTVEFTWCSTFKVRVPLGSGLARLDEESALLTGIAVFLIRAPSRRRIKQASTPVLRQGRSLRRRSRRG